MIELGQLEKSHQEFEKRKVRVVAVSIEGHEDAKKTQADYPHLVVVADPNKKLANALEVLHPESNPNDGGPTAAPTTILVDGTGKVRWAFRPDRAFTRLSPTELLAKVDEHLRN